MFAEVARGHTIVRVNEIQHKALPSESGKGIAEGDEIVAVDGRPTEPWLAAHPYESNSQNGIVARAEQARAIVVERLPWSSVRLGDARTLRVRRADSEWDLNLTFQRPTWEDDDEVSFDTAPSMKAVGCRAGETCHLREFKLAAVGTNVCVYKPIGGRTSVRKDTRLVRFVSFSYHLGESSDGLRAERRPTTRS